MILSWHYNEILKTTDKKNNYEDILIDYTKFVQMVQRQ